MNVIGPFPLYAILNPIYSQILHVCSIWNSFKIFTVSLSTEEIANATLKLIQNFQLCRSNRSAFHEILIYSPMISHDLHFSVRGWHMTREWEGSGARSSKFFGRTVFTVAINTPPLPHFFFTPLDLTPARASQTLAPPLLHRRRWGPNLVGFLEFQKYTFDTDYYRLFCFWQILFSMCCLLILMLYY